MKKGFSQIVVIWVILVSLALSGLVFYFLSQKNLSNEPVLGTISSRIGGQWIQNNFQGDINAGPYSINWNGVSEWNHYSSASGFSAQNSGFTLNSNGYLISSIFYTGNRRVGSFFGISWARLVFQLRGADTFEKVSSAPWIDFAAVSGIGPWCQISQYPYVQYQVKNTSDGPLRIPAIYINSAFYAVRGVVTDNAGYGIKGAKVSWDGGSITTYELYDLMPANKRPMSSSGSWVANYYENIPFGQIQKFTASADGYFPQSLSFAFPLNNCSTERGFLTNGTGTLNFVLSKTNTENQNKDELTKTSPVPQNSPSATSEPTSPKILPTPSSSFNPPEQKKLSWGRRFINYIRQLISTL